MTSKSQFRRIWRSSSRTSRKKYVPRGLLSTRTGTRSYCGTSTWRLALPGRMGLQLPRNLRGLPTTASTIGRTKSTNGN